MSVERRVLITAGASDIGLAMAQTFAQAGYSVWVADANHSELEKCPESWGKSHADVSKENGISKFFASMNAKSNRHYQIFKEV